MSSAVLPYLEWEWMQESQSFSTTEVPDEWPPGTREVQASRDDLYRLDARITGAVHMFTHAYTDEEGNMVSPMSPLGRPGSWSQPFSATAYSYGEPCILSDCLLGSSRSVPSPDSPELEHFAVDLQVGTMSWTSQYRTDRAWLDDWYVNGPTTSHFFTRFTRRNLEEKYTRQRPGRDVLTIDRGLPWPIRDSLLVDAGTIKYLVNRVPKGLGPEWARPLSIEFHEDWGIPPDADRQSIAEIVGFIMGRQLLAVGSSSLAPNGWLTAGSVTSPTDINIHRTCRVNDFLPVAPSPLDRDPNDPAPSKQEKLLQELTPVYMERRDRYRLADALDRYYVSFQLPLQAALPTIAAALESLADGWRHAHGGEPETAYLPEEEYRNLIGDEISSIRSKLASNPHKTYIVSRITSAWHPGTNQKVPWFLEKIGLPLGPQEKKILNSRHGPAHGAATAATDQAFKNLRGYQTLFNKAFLRVLDYDGPYINWSGDAPRERPMKEPVVS